MTNNNQKTPISLMTQTEYWKEPELTLEDYATIEKWINYLGDNLPYKIRCYPYWIKQKGLTYTQLQELKEANADFRHYLEIIQPLLKMLENKKGTFTDEEKTIFITKYLSIRKTADSTFQQSASRRYI